MSRAINRCVVGVLTTMLMCVGWALLMAAAALVFPPAARAGENPVPTAAARLRGDLVREAHAQWGLDAPVAVLAAQVHQESGWNPEAVSRVGASGLGQFMPATARWWCDQHRYSLADCQPTNPTWALRALVGYDRWLWDRLPEAAQSPGGDADRMWATLRAYNGGLGNWRAEAALAAGRRRQDIDAACGRARRAAQFCPENLGYPRVILVQRQAIYRTWGGTLDLRGE